MEFLVMLLAGFHWKIHLKFQIAGHEISGNASDWISLENEFHVWTWNFW
jgi:hypothetical protein